MKLSNVSIDDFMGARLTTIASSLLTDGTELVMIINVMIVIISVSPDIAGYHRMSGL